MPDIKPTKGNVIVRWLPENDKPEETPMPVSEGMVGNAKPYKEEELCQLEVMSGPNEGKIALASQWSLSQLIPGTVDQYFIEEASIEGYAEAPLDDSKESEDYDV